MSTQTPGMIGWRRRRTWQAESEIIPQRYQLGDGS